MDFIKHTIKCRPNDLLKNTYTMLFIFMMTSFGLKAQLGVGTTTPDASAQLEVLATDKGVLLSRMTEVQRNAISSPAEGLIIYCTDCKPIGLYNYISGSWTNISGAILDNSADAVYGDPSNMLNITSGTRNSLYGKYAGEQINSGGNNTIYGYGAGRYVTTGGANTIVGTSAGRIAGAKNVFLGYQAGYGESGSEKLYIENSTGSNPLIGGDFLNDKIGVNVPIDTLDSDAATFTVGGDIQLGSGIGAKVNEFSTDGTLSGNSNTAVPTEAAVKNYVDNASGNDLNIDADGNYFINKNSSNGLISAIQNIGIGDSALSLLTTADFNVAIGHHALKSNSTGLSNIAIGENSQSNRVSGAGNTSLGRLSMVNATSGSGNTAIGMTSLASLVNGSNNVAVGNNSLGSLQSGSGNIGIGNLAGYWETGSDKLYIENSISTTPLVGGNFANDKLGINVNLDTLDSEAATLTVGGDIQLGSGIGAKVNEFSTDVNMTGNSNTAVPTEAAVKTFVDNAIGGISINSGSIGTSTNTNLGFSNTLVPTQNAVKTYVDNRGVDASSSNWFHITEHPYPSGCCNVAYGSAALESVTSGGHNTGLGNNSLRVNATGSYNVGLGSGTLYSSTNGSGNIAIGRSSLASNLTGSWNIAIGFASGNSETGSNKLYIENSNSSTPLIGGNFSDDKLGVNMAVSALGSSSATLTVGGDIQLGSGTGAKVNEFSTDATLADNSTTAVPTESAVKSYVDGLIGADGSQNLAINQDLFTPTNYTGSSNTALGNTALNSLSSGSNNTAIGTTALLKLTIGNFNTAIGNSTLTNLVGGTKNVALGFGALNGVVGNSNNVAIGYNAFSTGIGSDNIFIGTNVASTITGVSNLLFIENTNSTTPLIGGNFSSNLVGIHRTYTDLNSGATFQVGGDASKSTAGSWIANSDQRLKKDIEYMDSEKMLQKMLQLKGATYLWNDTVTGTPRPTGIQYGFIAQDIEKVWPSKITRDGHGYLMTAYGDYDPMFVESIRALNNKIASLESQNENLKSENEILRASLQEMARDIAALKNVVAPETASK